MGGLPVIQAGTSALFCAHWSIHFGFRQGGSAVVWVAGAAVARTAEVVAAANHEGRHDQYHQASEDQPVGAAAGTAPLAEGQAPEVAEDDDEGHVDGPAREVVSAIFVVPMP